MDLAEFLLARIAEDEAAARAARDRGSRAYDWAWLRDKGFILADSTHIARHDPARVLAECEAKRAVIAELMRLHVRAGVAEVGPNDDPIFRMLAVPYADHADYREEWKP